MANHRTHSYDEEEVRKVMQEKNVTETQARQIIYQREYYKSYYEYCRDDRLKYFKEYRKKKKEENNGTI